MVEKQKATLESAIRGKRANVHFVEHHLAEGLRHKRRVSKHAGENDVVEP